ncbi:immunity 22 family protein [Psychromonas sp. PT13]|uniref:immunity 22 family protein n=1 Tax=Psychromonas sp. PT13 TaxID=3439547 RepID=UPI003EBFC7E4
MEKCEGWVAVWISTIDSYEELEEYTDDTWNSNGEVDSSQFEKDFCFGWYDIDTREFDTVEGTKTFSEMFNRISYKDKFIDKLLIDLENYNPLKFRSFMTIFDTKYHGNGQSDKAVFIGNYKYN